VIERWLAVATVDVFTLENVEEWLDWGPLYTDHNNGCGGLAQMRKRKKGSETRPPVWRCENPNCHYLHPIPEYRGFFFVSFVLALQDLGYTVDWRILNAADYGDPTTRRRLYLQAVRDGRPIAWPKPTHRNPKAKRGAYDLSLPTWRPASDCIDWSDLGQSIFERSKPLAPATMRRIAAGLVKFVLNGQPFIVKLSHGTEHGLGLQDVDEPLRTQTGQQDKAVVAPILVNYRGTDDRHLDLSAARADEPMKTITGGIHEAVVTPFLASLRGTGVDQIPNTAASAEDPLRTVSAGGNHAALIAPFLAQVGYGERVGQAPRCMDVQAPLGTVVAGGQKHGIVSPVLMTIDQQSTGESAVRSVTDPMSTATTKARHALVAATLMANNSNNAPHHPGEPIGAVTTGDRHYVVASFLEKGFGGPNGHQTPGAPIDAPLPTVTGRDHSNLVAAFLTEYYSQGTTAQGLDDPLHTVTTLARHGLVTVDIDGQTYVITDIRMRMLQPAELAKAMGFPDWFRWCDASGRPFSKRDAVKMIGNACDVKTVRELVKAIVMARPEAFGLATRGAA
jgi:DNA (cytosine-5)-methyltransferase 1